MNLKKIRLLFLWAAAMTAVPCAVYSQTKTTGGAKPIVFAVLDSGKLLEPIAFLENGKLSPTVTGGDDGELISHFSNTYYRAKARYRLVYGGAEAGTATVRTSFRNSDCARNMAEASVNSKSAVLSGMRYALATNAAIPKRSFVRRAPSGPERAAVDKLAREEFKFLNVDARVLKRHNLTAIDVDGDKRTEFVGSYYVTDLPTSRALLFIVVSQNAKGGYRLEFSNVGITHAHQVMSRDIRDLDKGILNELLLDVFDVDGDGVAEIFTFIQTFEGSNFRVHTRKDGRWDVMYEQYNYHCGY